MNAIECLEILKDIKNVAFATIDKFAKPQVRIIDIMLIIDEKVYFCTARGKEFYHELMANENVAISGMNKNFQMIRLNAVAKKMDNQKFWLDKIFEKNPSMNAVYPKQSRYILEVFCISKGNIEIFDLSKMPLFRQSFSFGNYDLIDKGFMINEKCVECGICKIECPQNCIKEATPYVIWQENCLHCGICYESCSFGAIDKKGEHCA